MDINTIFYFPSSLTFEEYSYKLNQGEISERTIVFADAQKSIYKGGKRYGSITMQEFHDLADTLHGNSWISDELTTVRENILDSIARLNRFYDTLTDTMHRLDHEIETRDENIQTKVEQLMDEAEWLQEHFPQGVTQWDSRWDSDIEAYLSLVGYWTTDANNNKITQWSKLQQQADSISSSVSSLKDQGNLTEALTASIQQLITGRIAQLELGTTYAKIAKTNDIEKVIEWMYSGFKSQASSDLTFAEMSSMAKNDFVSAISDIRTQVQKVANGDFVAQTELASKVGDTIAAMLLQSSSDNALAGMSARLNTVEQNTGTLSQNVASLVLGVTGSNSTADLATVVANKLAGFTTSADIDAAKTEIYSAIGAKDGNNNFISLASLKTQADNTSSSVSALSTTVSGLQTAQSGFVSQSDLNSAKSEIYSSISAKDGNNNFISIASLKTQADNTSSSVSALSTTVNGLQTAQSGFISQSDLNSAKSEIYSAIGAKDGSNNFISIASLKTQSDADHSSISGIATRVGTLETNQSGFVASANLGSSVAEMFASSGNGQNTTAKANVVALVKDNKSQLQLTASDVNIDGYLNAGSATFKGDVQATSFTTGNSNEIGIGVMSGEFNEQFANPNKAYFAYDSTQGGITMWYYQNNEWKRLNLANSAVVDSAEAFGPQTFYVIPDDSITIIPKNIQTVTLYYNRVTAKYYNTQDTSDPATGVYYTMPSPNNLFSVDSYFKSPHGEPSSPYSVACTVREVDSNGVKVKCGVLSEYNIIGFISKVTINNGSATTSQNNAMIAHAVVDLYTSQPKAVVAPVILSQYKNRIWDTTGAQYTGQDYYSSRIINLNGGIMNRTNNNGPAASMNNGHVMISLAEALAETMPQGWSTTAGGNLWGWSTSNSYTMIYPEDSSYQY